MVSTELLVSLVPLFPLLGFLIVALNTRRLTEGVTGFIACGSVLLSFIVAVVLFGKLLSLPESERAFNVDLFTWIAAGRFPRIDQFPG